MKFTIDRTEHYSHTVECNTLEEAESLARVTMSAEMHFIGSSDSIIEVPKIKFIATRVIYHSKFIECTSLEEAKSIAYELHTGDMSYVDYEDTVTKYLGD